MYLSESLGQNNWFSVTVADYVLQSGDSSFEVSSSTNSVAIYNITVDVVRKALTDTALGSTEVPTVIVSSMPCSIKWRTGSKKMTFNKKTYFLDAILNCRVPTGVTILTSDIIQYGGFDYSIVFLNDMNNLGVLLQIALERIE